MVAARIAETILRDEHAVIPIGSYNPQYGVTISLPNVLARHGVTQILEPEMSEEELQGFQRSADILLSPKKSVESAKSGCQSMILHAVSLPKKSPAESPSH